MNHVEYRPRRRADAAEQKIRCPQTQSRSVFQLLKSCEALRDQNWEVVGGKCYVNSHQLHAVSGIVRSLRMPLTLVSIIWQHLGLIYCRRFGWGHCQYIKKRWQSYTLENITHTLQTLVVILINNQVSFFSILFQ